MKRMNREKKKKFTFCLEEGRIHAEEGKIMLTEATH
jgi:hypothetical protein